MFKNILPNIEVHFEAWYHVSGQSDLSWSHRIRRSARFLADYQTF